MRIPRHEQGQARTHEALVQLAQRYGREPESAERWARAVLEGRARRATQVSSLRRRRGHWWLDLGG